jgi:2-polyprenyl-3-methyl-5-hydroxy-6-metoxy-1,4-benzoquinol methylase
LLAVPRLGSRAATRFNIAHCEGCGLLQTLPQPSGDELREAYGPAYTWQRAGGIVARAEARYRQLLVRCDQARALWHASQLAGGSLVLDVGCGDGLLITEARRIGLQAHGVDRPDAPLWPGCDAAWRSTGDIEGLNQPQASWDVVSLFHVLEHLRDPLRLLSTMRSWLRERGVLVIQVPNAGSWQARLFRARWYGFDVPRHLTHWTEATLAHALAQTGFAVVGTRYVSWRDNGPFFAGSLLPRLDPLAERERARATGRVRHPAVVAIRRLIYLCTVWACTPLVLLEAATRQPAVITVFARKAP